MYGQWRLSQTPIESDGCVVPSLGGAKLSGVAVGLVRLNARLRLGWWEDTQMFLFRRAQCVPEGDETQEGCSIGASAKDVGKQWVVRVQLPGKSKSLLVDCFVEWTGEVIGGSWAEAGGCDPTFIGAVVVRAGSPWDSFIATEEETGGVTLRRARRRARGEIWRGNTTSQR